MVTGLVERSQPGRLRVRGSQRRSIVVETGDAKRLHATLQEHLLQLPDPQRRRHELIDVLMIAITARLCGAENFVHMAQFGKAKEAWRRTFFGAAQRHFQPRHFPASNPSSDSVRNPWGERTCQCNNLHYCDFIREIMADQTFQAMIVRESDEKEFVREITTRNTNELPPGNVLIKVSYSSLNYKDALSASGHRGVTRKYPHTPGIDAAGVVVESNSPGFHSGEPVIVTGFDLGMNTPGGFAEFIRVPASWPIKLPKSLTLKDSMIYGTAGFTAALSLRHLEEHGLSPGGGPVLVTGATGGVGSTAVAILARAGYQVAAATGKSEARDFLLALGAANVIRRDEITDTTGKPLLKEQWAGVIDTVGGNVLATSLKSTRYGGSVACCGLVASPELPATVYPFILRGVNLLGIESSQCPLVTRTEIWKKLADEWKPDRLPTIASECSLEQLDGKIDLILQGRLKGRVVVAIGGG